LENLRQGQKIIPVAQLLNQQSELLRSERVKAIVISIISRSALPGLQFEKSSWRKKDPLVLISLVVFLAGIVLLVYGLIPQQRADYNYVSQGQVPVTDPSNNGTFVLSPEQYFAAHSSIPLDKVLCTPEGSYWICYGYQYSGTSTYHSMSSIYFGGITAMLGLVGVVVARRFAPVKDTTVHLRPIRIRVDEDICVANGVCVALAPKVFQFRSQQAPTIFAPMAYVLDSAGADNDTIILAAQMCPTGAIIIEDEETGERIHPPLPNN
jgi:ferredoxin